jgi:hypothetical protein
MCADKVKDWCADKVTSDFLIDLGNDTPLYPDSDDEQVEEVPKEGGNRNSTYSFIYITFLYRHIPHTKNTPPPPFFFGRINKMS